MSLLITRVGTIALMHTGMSKQIAQFQARSALTTSGFTTSESEQIMNNPLRRRIIMHLMLLGNLGVITILSSSILTVMHLNTKVGSLYAEIFTLSGGILFLLLLTKSKLVDVTLTRVIYYFLDKFLDLRTGKYEDLLHLHNNYKIGEFVLTADSALINQTFKHNTLKDKGVVILGVRRADGTYFGSPKDDFIFKENDLLTVYAKKSNIAAINDLQKQTA
jgi:Trk-type K+ transport system membrane component